MTTDWHKLILDKAPDSAGVIIDAIQRYLQFDTFGGIVPAGAIDILYTPEDLALHAEQAMKFYAAHHDEMLAIPEAKHAEIIRAHLCGLIKPPVVNDENCHDALTSLHEKNKKLYSELSTTGRVEMLLDRHKEADIVATAVHKYQSEYVPEYSSGELIRWTTDAKRFYNENAERLTHHSSKEQRSIIAAFLAGKLDSHW